MDGDLPPSRAVGLLASARPADGVIWQEVEGSLVLVELNDGRYYALDDVGTRMWNAVTTAGTLEEAAVGLAAVYAVAPEVLRADLVDFVTHLRDRGLLAVVAPLP